MQKEFRREWQRKKENCLSPSHSFNIIMCAGNQEWPMVCSCFPAGIVWPVFLVCIAVLVSGCMTGDRETDSALSGVTPAAVQPSLMDPAINETAAHDVNTSAPTPEPAMSLQGLVARPVIPADKSVIRSTTIPVIRTTETMSRTGPTLNATGSDVAMETLLIQKETLSPV